MPRTLAAATVTLALLSATPALAQSGKVEKGAQVYTAQKCSKCHAIAGKGNAKGKLDGIAGKLTPAEMRDWIVDPVGMAARHKETRKPAMKKVAMSEGDVDALVAYLSTLK